MSCIGTILGLDEGIVYENRIVRTHCKFKTSKQRGIETSPSQTWSRNQHNELAVVV